MIDLDALRAVTRPFEKATNLPGAAYADPRIHELERAEIFARMWVCVGREEDAAEPGSFFTTEVAGRPVLVTRAADGALRAFFNVCRHRGACLVGEERGEGARALRCNYHAWTYDLDGSLKVAPMMEERAGFDAAEHGLVPVRLDTFAGFVLVNLDAAAPSLAEQMHDFPDISRYGIENLRRGHRVVYEVEANWKIVCENYSECYHCALVHPQLNRVSDYRSGGKSLAGDSFNGGPMELNDGFETMSMTGGSGMPAIAGIEEPDRQQVHYFNLYPTFLIGLAPDYVIFHLVEPLATDRSRVVCDWLFPPATMESPDFDPEDVIEFWDVTNRQDWGLCEMVQKGAQARLYPGPYHPLEFCVHAFDKWFAERLLPALEARDNGAGELRGADGQA